MNECNKEYNWGYGLNSSKTAAAMLEQYLYNINGDNIVIGIRPNGDLIRHSDNRHKDHFEKYAVTIQDVIDELEPISLLNVPDTVIDDKRLARITEHETALEIRGQEVELEATKFDQMTGVVNSQQVSFRFV